MYKKKANIIIAFSTFLILFACKQDNASIRDYPEIETSGELNIVMEYNSLDYYIYNDTIKGIQYDFAKQVETRSGLKVNIFLENNLETSINKLKQNEYDIIARNIPITNEIKKQLAFTEPITKSKQVLVQNKKQLNDTTFISNQIDLAYKTIHIPLNSPALLRIENLSNEIASPIYIKEDATYTSEQLLYMVAFNEIDYAIVDYNIATNNLKLFPGLDINTDISFTQLQAWAVRDNSPILLDSLNIWLRK
ncbi:membrane-bound lytic murein transglycosylase F [Dysgonomonadaceae bacterium PH5-43]|nr:membrane-bound lytic murein transglycosylase F [Dysgonomonadaceae bacterium PH5-43]